jgi:hypothetical protein
MFPSISLTSVQLPPVHERTSLRPYLEVCERVKIVSCDIGALRRMGKLMNVHLAKFRLNQMRTGVADMQKVPYDHFLFSFRFGVHHSTLKLDQERSLD